MATKIRLQRHGRKGYAFYHIVVADSRAPRDGKFIERLGSYNPNTNPATIDLNFDRALYWVETGAQPTDTTRSLLSKKGVMMMKHLNGGVKKGAFSAEEADKKFEAWTANKEKEAEALIAKQLEAKNATKAERLSVEQALNKARAEKIAKRKAEEAAAKAEEAATDNTEATTTEEAPAE